MPPKTPTPSAADQTASLQDLITATLTQLTTYTTLLNPTSPTPDLPPTAVEPPSPLHLLRDTAKLIKAHVTKLSLLAINKPFTPSAVRKVLTELKATCIPALMSGSQICTLQQGAKWSEMMGREVQARSRRVVRELESLVRELGEINGGGSSSSRRNGSVRGGGGGGGDSLRSTGVVWESCDALIELETMGIGGLAVVKAGQYRDTIRDAIEELREWKEGEDLDSEGQDELLDEGDEGVDGDRFEDLFHAANSMPSDRPELRSLAEEADGKLKKVVLLYAAAIKRRFKTLKTLEGGEGRSEEEIKRLDQVMRVLDGIPHQVDELASCFYDLDENRVRTSLKACVDEAAQAAGLMERNWEDEEDEFTTWSGKWKEAIS
ncbi:hypothetical protein KC340_g4930 [Hortaea werneckii]|nr:hypothetical protein KC342_g5199 [Hortaea werneckii]KAI7101025.1 hypothetical protein KC339_g7052 [Hortaea werneckii]KAI7328848.1 hypothetical protein KC340_g4930 [Hortaea werneckii]KAI7373656.1 hypothetical protein KC328_g16506 [Hortaea werneckii]